MAALLQKGLHPVFFAKGFLTNEFDFETLGLGQSFGVEPNVFAEGLGELGVIKQANAPAPQIRRHPSGVTKRLQIATYENPVIAIENAIDLIRIFLAEQLRFDRSPRLLIGCAG